MENFKVHYLHVNRETEFDYRKLYSEWLSSCVNNIDINIDFSHFQDIVNQIIESKKGMRND